MNYDELFLQSVKGMSVVYDSDIAVLVIIENCKVSYYVYKDKYNILNAYKQVVTKEYFDEKVKENKGKRISVMYQTIEQG